MGRGMDITLDFKSKRVQGTVTLPASKSISNRVLIVNALADSELPIENLADCDDTQSMVRILCSENSYFDVGHAGTAMRFLTAYLSRIIGKWVPQHKAISCFARAFPHERVVLYPLPFCRSTKVFRHWRFTVPAWWVEV